MIDVYKDRRREKYCVRCGSDLDFRIAPNLIVQYDPHTREGYIRANKSCPQYGKEEFPKYMNTDEPWHTNFSYLVKKSEWDAG